MKEFIVAIASSCLISTAAFSITPYKTPPEPEFVSAPVLSPAIQIPDIEPAEINLEGITQLAMIAPVHQPMVEPKQEFIPLPLPRRPQPPDLLTKAKAYLGTNPTGWRSLWCARFMAMIAPDLARKVHNPNMARDWAVLPKGEPKVGAIVVLRRGGGRSGHIGIVSGFDKRGNPKVVSGNHNRKVGEGIYARNCVIAYLAT